MKTVYKWTGEYRPPKEGEWLIDSFVKPIQADHDFVNDCFILRREELPDDGGE